MATIEVIVKDKNGNIVPNVRINGSYQSMLDAGLGKIKNTYKVYSTKTNNKGECKFTVNKDFYIWFGVVSRQKAESISVSVNSLTQVSKVNLILKKDIKDYKVSHKFNFVDLARKKIPENFTQNQLLYRVSLDEGKSWGEYIQLTNPLIIESHVGEKIYVKLYTNQDKYDILKETGKNTYSALKYQSLGENFLDNVIVPVKYIETKTGQNKPMTSQQEQNNSNKCLSGFTDCPCQIIKFDSAGFMQNKMVDTSEKIDMSVPLQTPVAIVLHRTAGWTALSSINSGRTNKAVAHFYVCNGMNGKNKTVPTDGKIYQVLPITKKANHMGSLPFPTTVDANIGNHNTLSIEVSGMCIDEKWQDLTEKQAKSTACLLTALMRKYQLGYDKVHFHEDLCAKTDYEGRLVWIFIKKYLKNPPKGIKPFPYRDPTRLARHRKEGQAVEFKELSIYPKEN